MSFYKATFVDASINVFVSVITLDFLCKYVLRSQMPLISSSHWISRVYIKSHLKTSINVLLPVWVL